MNENIMRCHVGPAFDQIVQSIKDSIGRELDLIRTTFNLKMFYDEKTKKHHYESLVAFFDMYNDQLNKNDGADESFARLIHRLCEYIYEYLDHWLFVRRKEATIKK